MSGSCQRCGRANPPSACFCRGCGQPLAPPALQHAQEPPRCESCGVEPVPHALFCHRCGQPLASEAPTTMLPPSSPAPASGAADVAAAAPSGPGPEGAPATAPPPEEATTIVRREDAIPALNVAGRSPNPPAPARRCSACGGTTADGARFCRSCGAALDPDHDAPPSASMCSGCGKEVEPWASFCRHCGAATAATAVTAGASDGEAPASCVVCGAPAEAPGAMCAGCSEALPTMSSQRRPR